MVKNIELTKDIVFSSTSPLQLSNFLPQRFKGSLKMYSNSNINIPFKNVKVLTSPNCAKPRFPNRLILFVIWPQTSWTLSAMLAQKNTVFLKIIEFRWFHEIFISLAQCGNFGNFLTHFWRKIRESNVFSKEITKEMIWRNIFLVRVNSSFFHTVCPMCVHKAA